MLVQWYHRHDDITDRVECNSLIVPEVIFERESVRSPCYWHDFDYVPQACLCNFHYGISRVGHADRIFLLSSRIFSERIPTGRFRNESIECKIMARSAGRASRRKEKKSIRSPMRSLARKYRAHIHSNEIPMVNYRREKAMKNSLPNRRTPLRPCE